MNQLKYPLIVFLGACSYGLLSTVIKLAYRDGFTLGEVLNGQYFFGWCMLLVLVLLRDKEKVVLPGKKWALLTIVGLNAGLTGLFYTISLATIPASIAVVLLFQFTWMGILIEAVTKREFPGLAKLISVAVLLAGTVLASGAIGADIGRLSSGGIIFGLLSAVTYACLIYVSGGVATDVPAVSRSFHMITGSMLLFMIMFKPAFLYNGSLAQGLWKYGLILAVFGIVIPVIFFAVGVPRIGSGLGTILGAAELPTVVLASVLILRERVEALQWLGVTLILLGTAIPVIWQRPGQTPAGDRL